jgi:L-amino acid N-acyltransferase YncA
MTPPLEFDWITELSDADLVEMKRILDVVATTTGTNGFSEPLDEAQTAALASKIRYGLRAGTVHQLMVRAGGEVIGIITLESTSQPARRHIVEFRRAAIPPEHRGRFLRRGWIEVLRKCRAMGWEVAQIDVSEDGPIVLWERMGFRVFGRVQDYARVGARRLEGVYMTLDVEAAIRAIEARRRREP